MDLNSANRLGQAEFISVFGGVFEHAPWVAQAAWNVRPFASVAALHAAMMAVVQNAAPARQIDFLRNHPELAGHEARAGTMTDASEAEQESAGFDRLSAVEMARIRELNLAYGTKFGHPFIIAVRTQTKQSIFDAFERRLANSAGAERAAALAEVSTITRLRLDALFGIPAARDG